MLKYVFHEEAEDFMNGWGKVGGCKRVFLRELCFFTQN